MGRFTLADLPPVLAERVPAELGQPVASLSRQIEQAHANLPWCDGTGPGLAELEVEALGAFFAGDGTAALDEPARDWFVRLYDDF